MRFYLFAFILCLFLTAVVEFWYYYRKKPSSFLHKGLFFLFCVYLTLLFSKEIPPLGQWSVSYFKNSGYLSDLFLFSRQEIWDSLAYLFWFLPVGILTALLYLKSLRISSQISYGVILSFVTELLGGFGGRGIHVSHIALHLAGFLLGYLLGKILLGVLPVSVQNPRGRFKKSSRRGRELKYITLCLFIFSLIVPSLEQAQLPLFTQRPDFSLTADVNAAQAYVIHLPSSSPVYEKNCEEAIAPASTTKMLTALTAVDYCSLEEVVTVGEEINQIPSDSSRAWLVCQNQLTVKQLLTAMLLPSGNDAAYTLAVHTGRNIRKDDTLSIDEAVQVFVEAMNQKAEDIGAKSSHFVRPDGYDADGQYSTAEDLARIAKKVLDNSVLASIVGSYQISDTWTDGQEVTYQNTNELLNPQSPYYYPNAIGLKTGNSGQAGSCLVSAAKIHEQIYICVMMGDSDTGRWEDSLSVFHQIEQETLS